MHKSSAKPKLTAQDAVKLQVSSMKIEGLPVSEELERKVTEKVDRKVKVESKK